MISVTSEDTLYPLCVDLDGTLVSTDTLAELLLLTLRKTPLSACRIPFWLARGKSVCKRELAIRSPLEAELLPYNQEVVSFIHAAKARGQKVLLVTGADQWVADRIARHLDIFDEVIASRQSYNLVGRRKLNEMEKRFGALCFDYVGNSSTDLPVWGKARRVFVVSSATSFASFKRQLGKEGVEITSHVSRTPSVSPRLIGKALHIYEWARNLLLFVPLLLMQQPMSTIARAACGFLSFCLMTSAIHIIGDLLNLNADRKHIKARFSPFACGQLSLWSGLFLGPLFAGTAIASALFLVPAFIWLLLALAVTTFLYSRNFKHLAIFDVIMRAGLYLLPLLAGSILAATEFSTQTLGFCLLFFLGLATAERLAVYKG